jgi:hypothetical protein
MDFHEAFFNLSRLNLLIRFSLKNFGLWPDLFYKVLSFHPKELEDQKRIAVELLSEEIVDRRDVFTGIGPIGTRTFRIEVFHLFGKKRNCSSVKCFLDVVWQFPRQKLCGKNRLLRKNFSNLFPILWRNGGDLNR